MAEIQNINLGSIQAPYLEQILDIPAGQIIKFDYVHNCFSLINSTGTLAVNFGGAGTESLFTAGMYYQLTEPVPYVMLANKTNSQIQVHFACGIGIIKDNRLTVSGTVLMREDPFQSFTATTETIASGTATVSASAHTIIQNTGANIMYIGGTGTDGLQLMPNGTFEFTTSATVTVYGTDGDTLAIGAFN